MMKADLLAQPPSPDLPFHAISRGHATPHQQILTGLRKESIEFRIRMTIAKIALRNYKNPITSVNVLRSLDALRRKILGPSKIKKLAKIDGKFYWDLYTPGWPSPRFDDCMEGEMNRISPLAIHTNRFTNIFLAITKKCPLQCEHCFEWKALNGHEHLTMTDLKHMVTRFQALGTGQFQLTGGEPMLRVPEMVELLNGTTNKSDFWVLTSGFNLTEENAKTLKQAGLTGVVISLDHVDEEKHNAFRGYKHSFEWVKRAVKNAINANLVTALTLCPTREFVTRDNIFAYADLAKQMGVSFIQILEPRAVGHYEGRDISLTTEHEAILEAFFFKMNYHPDYADYPIVCYHGFHQRQIGCFGSANRNLYIDTDGDMHACPFCQNKMGSALSPDVEQTFGKMLSTGCHSFESFPH